MLEAVLALGYSSEMTPLWLVIGRQTTVTGVDRLLRYVKYSRGLYSDFDCSIDPLRIQQVSTGLTVITEPLKSIKVC